MIIFNGISSDEVGVIVEHYPKIVFPKRKVEVIQIPGRNGDRIIDHEAYENYDQTYDVFFDVKYRGGLEAAMPKIASWLLSGTGYGRLEDSYSKDFYRMAYVPEASEFLNYFNEYGRGSITFNCAPERWYKSGENEIQIQNGTTLHSPNLFTAMPLYRIGNYSIGLTFHLTDAYGTRSVEGQFTSGGQSYLDAKEHAVYRILNGEPSYGEATQLIGNFEDLYIKGDTEISWETASNSFTDLPGSIYITPRWWTI